MTATMLAPAIDPLWLSHVGIVRQDSHKARLWNITTRQCPPLSNKLTQDRGIGTSQMGQMRTQLRA
jgi:hypothetical protein